MRAREPGARCSRVSIQAWTSPTVTVRSGLLTNARKLPDIGAIGALGVLAAAVEPELEQLGVAVDLFERGDWPGAAKALSGSLSYTAYCVVRVVERFRNL